MKKYLFIVLIALIGIIAMSTTSVRNARLVSRLTVFENLVTPLTTTFIELNGADESINYRDGNTRTDADLVYADTVIKTGTIDFTSLTNSLGEALDLSGQVIMAIKFKLADEENATMQIVEGASDGYPLMGTGFDITLQANQSVLFVADSVLVPVASADKTIDYTGSSATAALYIILITADAYI